MLTFTVYGVPQSKGNMRALNVKGMKFPIVTESNRSAKSWQQLIAQGASAALCHEPIPGVLSGPVALSVSFYMPRPKKYQKSNRPVFHLKKPDLDKLLRAVLDALTGVVFVDDSQVVTLDAVKHYAAIEQPPHVVITVDGMPT